MRLRFLGAAEGDLDEADMRVRQSEIAVEREGHIEFDDLPLRPLRQQEDLTEAKMGHRVVRRETERFQDRRLGRTMRSGRWLGRIGLRENRIRRETGPTIASTLSGSILSARAKQSRALARYSGLAPPR